VNDGLMTLFFLLISLEIKREVVTGDLRHPKAASLPIIAALGGVLLPVAIFLLLIGDGDGASGWGIPMATDAAFAIGVLAILGMHLYDLQKKTNSPGLLTVIRARAAGQDLIAILKLEREVGVHVQIDEKGAKRVINLEFLRDLTLTRKTRVFKAAVVELADEGDPLTMQGFASDDQRSRTEGRGLAHFFLQTFSVAS
jgi:Na+/H+ antiporter 1